MYPNPFISSQLKTCRVSCNVPSGGLQIMAAFDRFHHRGFIHEFRIGANTNPHAQAADSHVQRPEQ